MDKVNCSFFGTSLGYSVSLFFIPLVILRITESPLMVSVTYALDILPYILFTPFIGWIGDRFNKKIVIVFGELSCLILSILMFFTPLTINFSFIILLIGFLISTFSALHHSIFQAIIPNLYLDNDLPKVNSNIATISSITNIIAPVIISSAFSFSYLNENSIICCIICCYGLSLFSFLFVNYSHSYANNKSGVLDGLISSWKFIQTNKGLKNFSYLFFFANFGLKMVFVNLIWIYSTVFKLENNQIAFNFILIGVFSILGAKFAGKYIVPKFDSRNVIILSMFFMSVFTILIPIVKNSFYLTFMWGMVSFLSMIVVVSYFTFRQKYTPKEILGRVVAITRLISYLAIPPSAIFSGYIIQKFNNENIIYILSGVIMLLSCLIFNRILKS